MRVRIARMREAVLAGDHHAHRRPVECAADEVYTAALAASGRSAVLRASARLAHVLDRETPVIFPDERIVLLRTVPTVPEIFTDRERAQRAAGHRIHELGKVSNVSPDYATTIGAGLAEPRSAAVTALSAGPSRGEAEFLTAVVESIDAVLRLSDRYADEADRTGHDDIAEVLRRVPRHGARTFDEALQMLRLLHYALWCSSTYHNTLGRFDQYLWPYLRDDLDAGRLEMDDALELVEEFFLACNRDSDLYPGVQLGDNGQSLVLGGVDAAGADAWNPLSDLSLRASLELRLIDPKINLRVDRATPLDRFVAGTRMTAQGLGFPQYSNDDVVIPGLVRLGYSERDARNYVVAACWEFIIPAAGMDVPNIAALSFPAAVDVAVHADLASSATFEDFLAKVRSTVRSQAVDLATATAGLVMEPAPLLSILMDGCIASARDVSNGLRYNNYGIHGVGLSTAADSLAAIKKLVFDESRTEARHLIDALDSDFDADPALRDALRFDAPKLGNDIDEVDLIAADLLQTFADALEPLRNDRGGRFRAGTGSAMFYVAYAATLGATADGRRSGEYLSANLAPSLGVKVDGPLSVVRSFTKLPFGAAINGGPLTIELHDTVFRSSASTEKVAMLVRDFIYSGGHQLQINALNRESLRDAQVHPERHRNLIVRVWGWSAYFVDLDKEYQDHIIQRVELTT